MTTDELLSGMVTEEVEPGVLRVVNDGVRDLSYPEAAFPAPWWTSPPTAASGCRATRQAGPVPPRRGTGVRGRPLALGLPTEKSLPTARSGPSDGPRTERRHLLVRWRGMDGAGDHDRRFARSGRWPSAPTARSGWWRGPDKYCPTPRATCSAPSSCGSRTTAPSRPSRTGPMSTMATCLGRGGRVTRRRRMAHRLGRSARHRAEALLRFDGEAMGRHPGSCGVLNRPGGPVTRLRPGWHAVGARQRPGCDLGGLARFDDSGWTVFTEADGVEPWGGQGWSSSDLLTVAPDGSFWLNGGRPAAAVAWPTGTARPGPRTWATPASTTSPSPRWQRLAAGRCG